MKHIFISYSPKDSRDMMILRDQLLRIGYKPWLDPQPRPGQDWRFDIDDAIRSSDGMIVIVSPAAAESVYVTYEWSLALGLGVPVIPLIFRPARMHPRLQTLEHFDTTAWTDPNQFWDYFLREIQRVFQVMPQAQSAVPQPMPQAQAPAPAPNLAPPPTPFTRVLMPRESGFWLVVRRGPQLNSMYRLAKDLVILGRDKSSDIVIDDPEVSRNHLRFTWLGDGYAVEDLGSRNGTRLNGGTRLQGVVRLTGGNTLMLGDTIALSFEAIP